jgi:hypothetical protein
MATRYATQEWVDWVINRNLRETFGKIPLAKAEANRFSTLEHDLMAAYLISIRLGHARRGSRRSFCLSVSALWRYTAPVRP